MSVAGLLSTAPVHYITERMLKVKPNSTQHCGERNLSWGLFVSESIRMQQEGNPQDQVHYDQNEKRSNFRTSKVDAVY